MADDFSYPGIYVQEVPSGVRAISGVSSSATAFVDVFARGPVGVATRITSWAAFETVFGGLWAASEASYAVQQFFLAGGGVAWIVRITASDAAPAAANLDREGGDPDEHVLAAQAVSAGEWGNAVQIAAYAPPGTPADRFNLAVREVRTTAGISAVVGSETYLNLSTVSGAPNNAVQVVNAGSALVRLAPGAAGGIPTLATPNGRGVLPDTAWKSLTDGKNGGGPTGALLIGDEAASTGLHALDRIAPAIFNLLCLPAAAGLVDLTPPDPDKPSAAYLDAMAKAAAYCQAHRAFLVVDPPVEVTGEAHLLKWLAAAGGLASPNAAFYYPRLLIVDNLAGGRLRNVGPSGTVAGIIARTDATRGVWKAPAGTDSLLTGASLAATLTDGEQGALNPLGINVLRTFPVYGPIIWGARTLYGADQRASEWKYIPVRRTALYIEESLFQGLRWVVFEPNDEPLWAQIRLNVDTFMNGLYRQGAFQGATAAQAYMVKCDATTTLQGDIDRGVVNILVGFAPLKPAEFVVLRIQQLAGQDA